MTDITLEDLNSFRGLSSELKALQAEREWFYYPVSSPNGKTQEGHGSLPSDPTASAFRKIQEMDARIAKRQADIAERLEHILNWIDNIQDAEIRSMIHWYYLIGDDWADVCKKVYGYRSSQACRKRVMRYFGYEK